MGVLIQLGSDEYLSYVSEENESKILDSNSTIVSASSYAQSNLPYKAFEGNLTDNGWVSDGNNNQWLLYDFIEPTLIDMYEILQWNGGVGLTASPKEFRFEGSNDKTVWDILDTQFVTNWVADAWKSFKIENKNKYRYYRIYIVSNNGNSQYIKITEMKMSGSILFIKKMTVNKDIEQNLINHGMDTDIEIDLSKQTTKKVLIEQNPTNLGVGKVFSRKIDTSKTPIKKMLI